MYLYEVPDGPAAAVSLSLSLRRGRRGDANGSGPAVAPRRSFACPAGLLRPAWTRHLSRSWSSVRAPGWQRPGLDRLVGCMKERRGFFFFLSLARCHPPSLPCASLPCALACLVCLPAHCPLWFRRPHPSTRSTQDHQAAQARPLPLPSTSSTGSSRAPRSTRSTSCFPLTSG